MEMQVLNIPVAEILNMLIMLLGVAIVIIAAISYHKRSSIRMQAAHQKIDELSQRMAEQEKALLKQQQHLYDLDKRLNTIRTQHPTPEKTWTNYHSMLQDIDSSLNGWMATLESRTQLAEREVQFCTYLLVYPHLTLDEIAQHICYSEKSIRNYKQRIAQKLGVSSADLYQHLQKDIIAYLHNDNTNLK